MYQRDDRFFRQRTVSYIKSMEMCMYACYDIRSYLIIFRCDTDKMTIEEIRNVHMY